MVTPIAVMSSDNHLAVGAWAGQPEIYGDSYRALRQIVSLCITKRLPLILAGDFFDANRPPASALQAALMLNEIIAAGLDVFYIQAQHDFDDPSYLSVVCPKAVDLNKLEKPIYIPGGSMKTMCGRNFMSRVELAEWLEKGQVKCNLMVMHQLWIDFMGKSGQANLSQLNCCDLLLTGDFHQMRFINVNNGMSVFSPGATQMQTIKDPTEHYVGILNDDMSTTIQQLNSRGVVDIVIEREDQVVGLINDAKGAIALGLDSHHSKAFIDMTVKPIVRFRMVNAIQNAVPRLEEAFGPHAVPFFIGKEDKTEDAPLMFEEHPDLSTLQEATAVMASNFAPDDPTLRDAMELVESSLDPAVAVRTLRSRYVEVPIATPS